MLNSGFSPWPSFSEEEGEIVKTVLLSNKVNYWTGEEGRKFEDEFANKMDCKFAVAVSNGTVALELSLRALNIGNGDEVITTPRTFIATASSIVNVGAKPVFADVDINTQNITVETISEVISEKTKAIIVVHLAGVPADMPSIMEYAKEHDLKVVEDCAQAHGAKIDGRSVGSFGHVGAWSFCQDKIMTTAGEGGMVTTNDADLWSYMWSYKDHGKDFDTVYNVKHSPGFRWLHKNIGTNWRMTEMQSAIGRYQLKKLDSWQKQRKKNSQKINEAVKNIDCIRQIQIPKNFDGGYYKHYLFLEQERINIAWNRDEVIQYIVNAGVPCYQGSCSEVYLEGAFEKVGDFSNMYLRNTRKLGESSLMFLIHPTLTEFEISKTCQVLQDILRKIQQ